MKLTDAFAKVIRGLGIEHVFGLQGGAVVHFLTPRKVKGWCYI